MSLCINSRCHQPDHPGNDGSQFCQSCGSDLVLQGRYRVMRLLSNKSGFGRVYEAYERSVPKILKVLKENHSTNAKAIELFQQEASVISQLQHPSIPQIEPDGYFQFFPRGSADPLHCIIMEKIDGPNLSQWMRQQGNHPISEKQALNWLQQLTSVLHLVHQKNYFHRDIKPENIMLRSNGQLVLVDFGAAREMTYTYLAQLGSSSGVTRISSAGYTPPEQEQGQAVPQSDFYALGRTFIFLLTGKQPTDQGVYDSLNNEFHWREYAPHISSSFAQLIDKLIAPKVADRPKNTQEILSRLDQIFRELPESSRLSVSQHSLPTLLPQNIPTVYQSPFAPKTRRLLGGAVALLVCMTGGYGLWRLSQQVVPYWSHQQVVRSDAIELLRSLEGHTSFVNSLVLSPDGQTLISGSADLTIKIWDFNSGREVRTLRGHLNYVNAIDISPDGRILASGSANKDIKIWDIDSGQELRTLIGHLSSVNVLDFSPDGQVLASGGADRSIHLWNVETGRLIRALTGHASSVNTLVFSPDGQTLASGGADNTIRLWNLATGEEVGRLVGHTSFINALVFSPDGQQLMSGSADRTIKIWTVVTGEENRTLTGHTGYVNALVIRPDGQILASAGADQTIRLWDLTTGRETRTLTGYGAHVNYFVVSPDWRTMASGSDSKTIKVWRVPE